MKAFDRLRIGLVLAAAAIYLFSPADLLPGLPYDDFVVVALAILRAKQISE